MIFFDKQCILEVELFNVPPMCIIKSRTLLLGALPPDVGDTLAVLSKCTVYC